MLTEQQIQKIWENKVSETLKIQDQNKDKEKREAFRKAYEEKSKKIFLIKLESHKTTLDCFSPSGIPKYGIPPGEYNKIKNRLLCVLVEAVLSGGIYSYLLVDLGKQKYVHDSELISTEVRDHYINRHLLENPIMSKEKQEDILHQKKHEIILHHNFNYMILSTSFECLEKLGNQNLIKRIQYLHLVARLIAINVLLDCSKTNIEEKKRKEFVKEFDVMKFGIEVQIRNHCIKEYQKLTEIAKIVDRMKFGYDDVDIWDILVDPKGVLKKINKKSNEKPQDFLRSLFGLN
jgi:hypothetical protein